MQDLCRFLVEMGAKIEGIGTNRCASTGVDALRGCDFRIGPDHIEIGSFIGLGAVTAQRAA